MHLSKRIALLFGMAISSMIDPMELPPKQPALLKLISSDGKEIKLPLEIIKQTGFYREILQKYKAANFTLSSNISSQVLTEISQFMQMLYQNQDLGQAELINKAEKEIRIHDNYAFAVAVKYWDFEPGIALISEKYRKSDYFFPQTDYEYYMKLIEELNPKAYEKLKKCRSVNRQPCLVISLSKESEGVIGGSELYQGYPILAINPGIKLWNEKSKKNYLKKYLDYYNENPIASILLIDELKTYMSIIKDLAPSLYEAIVAVDPTGADHIKRDDSNGSKNAFVGFSKKDGLPVLFVGSETNQTPREQLRFTIAHELGHYVLDHIFEQSAKKHKILEKIIIDKRILKKGKEKAPFEISGQLPFEKSFQLAFSRTQEFEADRFAVIELGVSIDDAIATVKSWITEDEEHKLKVPEKETFKSTHPFSTARILQFEDLRREVELHQAQKGQPKPINWKALAAQYLKKKEL